MRARLLSLLAAERPRLFLWSPVGIMIGIFLYFAPNHEPPLWLAPLSLVVCAAPLAFLWRTGWRLLAWPLVLIALGFCAAELRAHMVATPLLSEMIYNREVQGVIDQIDLTEKQTKLTLSHPDIEGVMPEATPRRIRVSFRNDDPNLRIGDRVRLSATLYPLPEPIMPGSYDFARHFYFLGVGAVGFALHPPELVENGARAGASEWLSNLRHAIGEDMRAHMPGASGTVAAAMTVGETGPIPEDTKNTLRDAGLAHMLAIAGLHLGIVTGIIFFVVRLLLTLYPPLALRLPVKKIAAVCALLSAFIYLSLAGFPIPAQRAFIMVLFLFTAVLLDRRGVTLRTLAIAAIFVLLVFPEAMFGASFQLSFAATLAIVAFYERFGRQMFFGRETFSGKIFHHALGIAATSLVATLATSPFMLYDFNRFAVFGLIANMLVIPLATFIIMPGMALSLILMPLGLQAIGYAPLNFGVTLMIRMADFVTHLPFAALRLPAPTDAGLALAAFGLLWLCLMTKRWRLLGVPAIALGVSTLLLHRPPDILISDDARQIMVRLEDGHYAMLKGTGRSFVAENWLRSEGQEEPTPLKETDIDCDKEICRYRFRGKSVIFVKKPQDDALIVAACAEKPDALIAWWYLHKEDCAGPALLIGKEELKAHGAEILWLAPQGIMVSRAKEAESDRPWRPKAEPSEDVAESY